jgi:hypothetical protein
VLIQGVFSLKRKLYPLSLQYLAMHTRFLALLMESASDVDEYNDRRGSGGGAVGLACVSVRSGLNFREARQGEGESN